MFQYFPQSCTMKMEYQHFFSRLKISYNAIYYCDKTSREIFKIKQHVEKNHSLHGSEEMSDEEKKKKFQCGKCDSSFSLQKSLNRHVRQVHDKIKPYKCDQCENFFLQKSHLEEHV